MSNELTTFNPTQVSNDLVEMRIDTKKYPRLFYYPKETATREMAKIVTQAFLYRGQAVDPTNIQFISSSLVDELLSEDRYGARNISFAEISRAVRSAILGGQEMFGISVASLYKVIIDYVKGEGHRIQEEANRRVREERRKDLEASPLIPMIQAFTGEFIKNNKI